MKMEIEGVKLDIEYDMDSDNRIESIWVFVGDGIEIGAILSDKVMKEISEKIYETHEGYDPRSEPEYWEDR